ncbi:Lysylphosphatidylglycerol synthase TM region [uncultured archaeon]|nr:Lysylphosphatidylglycerol synthase TM region [uncultured archaeon]
MKLGQVLSFIVGGSILLYLFNKIGFGKIKAAVLSLNPVYMLGFFFFIALSVILKGLKWKMSLGIFDIKTKLLDATEMWIIGFSIGAMTPGRMGDFVKILYLDEKKSKSMGAVLLDRLTDVFAVLVFALMGLGIFGSAVGSAKQMIFLAFAALLAGILILKKYHKPLSGAVLSRIVPKKYRASLKEGAAHFFESSRQALKYRKRIFGISLMSVFIWMVSGLQGFIIARSLGIGIGYLPLLFILSIVALVELIPITVAGLGTREATIVFLMSVLGVESEKAIVFSLVNFIFGYLVLALVGYVFWLRRPVSFGNAKRTHI